MRKRVFGRHLKRDTNERKALFKNLMTELILRERITTTEEKAKSVRGKVEKLITKAKKKGPQSEYLLQPYLSADAVKKMIADVSVRFADRPGGYTRIIKLGNRFNDNASMAVIELVDRKEEVVNTFVKSNKDQKTQEEEIEDLDEIQEAEIVAEEPNKKTTKGTKEPKEKKAEKKEKVTEKEKAKTQKQKVSKGK
ncbi:MAG TPA: 50S ribosomal protein L17 [Candidatus Saccharimonadales bacterium]|nr:50S ribosomal protein L17 [Candidatus Saccharimonadales bacterium]